VRLLCPPRIPHCVSHISVQAFSVRIELSLRFITISLSDWVMVGSVRVQGERSEEKTEIFIVWRRHCIELPVVWLGVIRAV
jgi:hypothetical protein